MGNASRALAILQAIRKQSSSAEIHVFTWGRGHEFLAAAGTGFELHELRPYAWSGNWASRLAAFVVAYVRNVRSLAAARREYRPCVVLLDSDYHFPAFLGRGLRIYCLGQAADVLLRASRFGYRPRSWASWSSYWVGEWLDAWLQAMLAHKVFVPSFIPPALPTARGCLEWVPLIVREEFRKARTTEGARIAAFPGGSGLEAARFIRVAGNVGAEVLAARGPLMPELLQGAATVVVQGGLSSISECISLGKKMIVVPIQGRAEQELNAQTVNSLGWGAEQGAAGTPHPIRTDGADVVAGRLLE